MHGDPIDEVFTVLFLIHQLDLNLVRSTESAMCDKHSWGKHWHFGGTVSQNGFWRPSRFDT